MLGYIVRRLLGAIPTLLVIIAITFFMMRLAPGGPFDGERRLPPEVERNIKAAYDLDKSTAAQFFRSDLSVCAYRLGLESKDALTAADYAFQDNGDILGPDRDKSGRLKTDKRLCLNGYLGKLMTGDFGPSFKNKDFTVSEMIADGAPVSITLGLSAITLAVLIGSTLGVIAALRQNTATDYSVMSVAMIGITIPTFVTAPFLTLVLGVYWHWLPVAGYNEGAIRNLILPVIVLALPQIAIISRLVRGSMVEVLRSNFVRTARAKGLTEFQVVWRHALRAGLLPLVSYLGPAIAGLMTGSLVVERIFGLPGIGQYFVTGALNRDYTLVMGVVILFATLVIILNLIADIMYRVLDPRVKLG